MKKQLIIIFVIGLLFIKVKAQDSVTYYSNTKTVLEHFSEQFINQHKVIVINSFTEPDNVFCYNIYIVNELSQALCPQPLFYYKYKNLVILYKNSHYFVDHSKDFLINYIKEIKKYVINDVIVEGYKPLKLKIVNNDDLIETGGASEYYCYKIQHEKILTFNKTTTPFTNPCLFNQSY